MITIDEYQEAIRIVKLYEDEQRELENSKRMTVRYFVEKIPRITGKDSTCRLINCLLSLDEPTYIDEIKPKKKYGTIIWNIRNFGEVTYMQFLEYKSKIIKE